jgi:hypothetical protein
MAGKRKIHGGAFKLFFYSWGSVFDVSPLLMDRESHWSDNPSATSNTIISLKLLIPAV